MLDNFKFEHDSLPGRVIFGCGSRWNIANEIDLLDAKRVLLIASPDEGTIAQQITEILGSRVVAHCENVIQHVPIGAVEKALALSQRSRSDLVLTVGGGSATGLGKAIALEMDLPVAAIPTTYAGSEMTPIWGMSSGDRKKTGRNLRVLPSLVVYDPELTLSLPPAISGTSGINALAHCIEATYGAGTNPFVTLWALEGMKELRLSLPVVTQDPKNIRARTQALYGAYLAGSALAVAGTGLHHKACHVLGGMFNLGHGELNAVILPHALKYNQASIPIQYQSMCDLFESNDAAQACYEFAETLGAPHSLAQLGMPSESIDEAASRILYAASSNVRIPDITSIRTFLENAFQGIPPSGY